MAPTAVDFWTGAITYSGTTLEFGALDADGTAWTWCGLERDVGTVGEVTQKSGDHGGWPTPAYFAPATYSWRVSAQASTQALRDKAIYYLSSLVPVNDLAELRIDESTVKYTSVRRSGRLLYTCDTLTSVDFVVGLVAPDPRLYAAAVETSIDGSPPTTGGLTLPWTLPITFPQQAPQGGATISVGGYFPTPPTIEIYGPRTNPGIRNGATGEEVNFTGLTLAAGDTLILDFGARRATLNGVYWPADITSSWWTLPPGDTLLVLQGTSATSAGATVTVADAYM